jgi:hypothetical protein
MPRKLPRLPSAIEVARHPSRSDASLLACQ